MGRGGIPGMRIAREQPRFSEWPSASKTQVRPRQCDDGRAVPPCRPRRGPLMRALAFLNAGDFDNCEREPSLAETPVESRPPQYVANASSRYYPLLTIAEHRANL